MDGSKLALAAEAIDGEELQEALDECKRELGVRERCFPRWVKEGRLTETDCKHRLGGMRTAVSILDTIQRAFSWSDGEPVPVTSSGDKTVAPF
jgi:hypothetical protein